MAVGVGEVDGFEPEDGAGCLASVLSAWEAVMARSDGGFVRPLHARYVATGDRKSRVRSPAWIVCKAIGWSEQQHHLAGPLGTALADRLFALDWVRRTDRRRVVRVTDSGRENLPRTLGLRSDWDQRALVSEAC